MFILIAYIHIHLDLPPLIITPLITILSFFLTGSLIILRYTCPSNLSYICYMEYHNLMVIKASNKMQLENADSCV